MQHWREDASGIVKSIFCSPCIKESFEGFLLFGGYSSFGKAVRRPKISIKIFLNSTLGQVVLINVLIEFISVTFSH